MKFVHAADLHIDSPLRGLEHYEGAPVERVRLATRSALANLVNICINEQASFLVVAGDLFDYDWRDFNTALFVVKQIQLLKRHAIAVYVIRGNHDSRDEMSYRVPWPDNLKLLNHLEPETVLLEDVGVAIHGMSFPKREVLENLVPRYPKPIKGLLNIGLLHTNATGNLDHDSYAPCGVNELVAKGYDYWALGHVHQYDVLHDDGARVVYAGNTQGRHIREQGEKGCVVVTAEDQEITSLRFRTTDVLRWRRETLSLRPEDGIDELHDLAEARLREIADEVDGRLTAVRLEVQGRCRAHQRLVDETRRQEAVARLRSLPGEFSDDLWVEKIKLDTRPTLDRDQLRQGRDLVGDLLRDVDAIRADENALRDLGGALQKLAAKVRTELAEDEIDFSSLPQLAAWLSKAEDDLVSRLTEQGA
jgi:DNA repair exonuclease SbcCD nuclease subunit